MQSQSSGAGEGVAPSGRRPGRRRAAAPAGGPARRCRSGPGRWPRCGPAGRGPGSASQARSGSGSVASNHWKPNAASSRATGNPPTAIGLRCSADSISGSPKPSHVEGSTTASQAAYAPGIRTSNGSRRRTGTRPAGQHRVQLGLVAVLGRSGQPVGAAHRPGEPEPDGDALARDRPGRLQHQRLVADPHPAPYRGPLLRAGALGEAVVDVVAAMPAALPQLAAGQLVDRHVPPGRVGRAASCAARRTAGAPRAGRGGAAPPGGRAGSRPAPRPRPGSSAASRRCRPPRGRRRRGPRPGRRGPAAAASPGPGCAPARRGGRRRPPCAPGSRADAAPAPTVRGHRHPVGHSEPVGDDRDLPSEQVRHVGIVLPPV